MKTKLAMMFSVSMALLFSGVLSFAAATSTLDADVLKSADHAKIWTMPGATDTIVGRASTDTLTNKSISGSTNTLTNISLTASVTGALPILNGGTGQTSANSALNALLPSQTGNSGTFLTTNGSNTSWASPGTSTLNVVTKTSNYNLANSNDVVILNGSGITLTLQASSGATSKAYYLTNAGTSSVSIAVSGSDTVQGQSSQTLAPGASAIAIPDGSSAWYVF